MKPTTCTLLLNIFISTSVHVSGTYVPIISRTYCTYATLVFFTVYVESFKYLGSILTNDGRCTCEIKCRNAIAKAAFNKKRAGSFYQHIGLRIEEEACEVLHLELSVIWC